MDISNIREFVKEDKIRFTDHFLKRIHQRKIKIDDIISAFTTGEIIEEYPDDYPYPSYLILGLSTEEKELHLVCGVSMTDIWLITAYHPDREKWSVDFKIRKG